MGSIRRSGSEVMGLMAPGCRLAPTDDSLKTPTAGPSSSQPFSYCRHFSMSPPKSQLFFAESTHFFTLYKKIPPTHRKNRETAY